MIWALVAPLLGLLPYAFAQQHEQLKESLTLEQYPNGNVFALFNFTTTADSIALSGHYSLLPRAIGEIIRTYGVEELHLTFTQVFCASLNFIDQSNTAEPVHSFEPEGSFVKRWRKDGGGYAKLFNAYRLYDSDYHSMSIKWRTVCEDYACTSRALVLSQTVSVVLSPRDSPWMTLTRSLKGSCPLASTSEVNIRRASNVGSEFSIIPALYNSDKKLLYATFDLKTDTRELNLGITNSENLNKYTSSALGQQFLVSRHLTANFSVLSTQFQPAIDRVRPSVLELFMRIPPQSHVSMRIDFDIAFLNSSVVTVFGENGTAVKRLFTENVLIALPTPDFSMPYNVITMTCTFTPVRVNGGSGGNAISRLLTLLRKRRKAKAE
ncbi:Gpi16 subunit, GPI transamidase component-domain-containing protein [Chytridium lagenaria]|nr:Gpi16 subunit, GPI transamidase component-domain-containing protein [Chytridium lagenaria]